MADPLSLVSGPAAAAAWRHASGEPAAGSDSDCFFVGDAGAPETAPWLAAIPLAWDTEFFAIRMGRLVGRWDDPGFIAAAAPVLLNAARAGGYHHLRARLPVAAVAAVAPLAAAGFRLLDVGLGLTAPPAPAGAVPPPDRAIAVAGPDLLPLLRDLSAISFGNSFLYRDPFFRRDEIDELHRSWISNLLAAPDTAIFTICDGNRLLGYATRRRTGTGPAVIDLLAVAPEAAGQGIATSLLRHARTATPEGLTTRTQLQNRAAANLYCRNGFRIDGADLTLCLALRQRGDAARQN